MARTRVCRRPHHVYGTRQGQRGEGTDRQTDREKSEREKPGREKREREAREREARERSEREHSDWREMQMGSRHISWPWRMDLRRVCCGFIGGGVGRLSLWGQNRVAARQDTHGMQPVVGKCIVVWSDGRRSSRARLTPAPPQAHPLSAHRTQRASAFSPAGTLGFAVRAGSSGQRTVYQAQRTVYHSSSSLWTHGA